MPTVYATAPPEAAEAIARTVVDERLAACVNRVDCASTYRWEGEVVTDDEVVLLAKTTDDGVADLVERLRAIHPYDVPCIETFAETDVVDDYRAWIEDCVE